MLQMPATSPATSNPHLLFFLHSLSPCIGRGFPLKRANGDIVHDKTNHTERWVKRCITNSTYGSTCITLSNIINCIRYSQATEAITHQQFASLALISHDISNFWHHFQRVSAKDPFDTHRFSFFRHQLSRA